MATPRKPKKPKDPKKSTRTWQMFTEKGKTKVWCFADPQDNCSISPLWETTRPSEFHDSDLAKATKEINAIINRIDRSNKDKERELCFIKVQDRLMLVWAFHGVVKPSDEGAIIARALNLKQTRTRTNHLH